MNPKYYKYCGRNLRVAHDFSAFLEVKLPVVFSELLFLIPFPEHEYFQGVFDSGRQVIYFLVWFFDGFFLRLAIRSEISRTLNSYEVFSSYSSCNKRLKHA